MGCQNYDTTASTSTNSQTTAKAMALYENPHKRSGQQEMCAQCGVLSPDREIVAYPGILVPSRILSWQ